MSIFEHSRRARVYTLVQHPLRHTLSDFGYTNESLPGVTTLQATLDYMLAVLYPQTKPAVADPASLPLLGNTINDFRVVNDDGDGKAAAYRWEQREGEVSASWHKIYDMDWGSDSILQDFYLKTQDIYVHRLGYDDIDASGNLLSGTAQGQHIYGGRTANGNLTLHANAGDGTGAQTGFVQTEDPFRPLTNNTLALGTTTLRWSKVWTNDLTSGTLTAHSGSIVDSGGSISFGSNALTTTGAFSALTVAATTSALVGTTLALSTGSIIDSSGALSFGANNLTTTGFVHALSFTANGTLVLAGGSVTDTGGSISFGSNDLSTTGTLSAGNTTLTRVDAGNLRLAVNTLSAQNANGNVDIAANGSGVVDVQSAMTTIGQTVTGNVGVSGFITVSNLKLNGDTLSTTDVNGNLILSPNGSGLVSSTAGIFPSTTSSFDLGKSGNAWNSLWLTNSITDGTTSIASSVLQSLRNINVGVGLNYTIFWDGAKWVASAPDTEIDHNSLSNLAVGDVHTQYMLLAGRAGGQSLVGGSAASNNMTLESTSNATKGKILTKDTFASNTDASFSGSWSGADLGGSGNRFRHVYTAGEFFGLRLENVAADPSPSAQNPGRLVWNTTAQAVKLDNGTSIIQIGSFKYETDTAWDGSTSLKNVTVSGIDATKALWQLKNNTNNYEVMFVSVQATTTTNVRITVNSPLPAGSYRLEGIQ